MGSAAYSAYLNTRVAAKATQLLQAGELARLSRLGLADIAQRFGLSAILDQPGSARTRIRAVEQAMVQVLLAELAVLVRPMRADERALVLAWARQYALFNLKTLLRGKIRQLDPAEIRENLYDLPAQVRLSHEDLFRAESAVEMLRYLERGPLSLLARQAREIYERRQDAFALEAAIDQRYYGELADRVARLDDRAARGHLATLVGALVDCANILWLMRFRFGYQLSPSETYYQLVPSPGLLTRPRLLQLVALDEETKVLAALPEPLRGLLADSANLMEIQRRLAQYRADVARSVLRQDPSGVGRALAYLILRESDLRLLFGLVQGRLLQLPTQYVDLALGLSPAICVHRWGVAA